MPRRKKANKKRYTERKFRFESNGQGGIVGLGVSWLIDGAPVIVMAPDDLTLEEVAKRLKKSIDHGCISSVVYKELHGNAIIQKGDPVLESHADGENYVDPVGTKPPEPEPLFCIGKKAGKDEMDMFYGPFPNVLEVHNYVPDDDEMPCFIFHLLDEKTTPVFRWSRKNNRWERMNLNIFIKNDPDEIPF